MHHMLYQFVQPDTVYLPASARLMWAVKLDVPN